MKHEQLFDVSVWFGVLLLHILTLFALLGGTPPQLTIGVQGMELVELGDLNLGKATQAVQTQPLPKPKPEPKKKLLSVKDLSQKADIVEKPKPKPKLEPKPQERSLEPVVRQSTASAGENTGSDLGTSRTAAGGSQEGSGQGVTVATHLGGHLNNPKPPYPPLSIENNEQGSVRLRVVVEPNGLPSSVELARSSGYSRLDNSALRTVRDRYRFVPATRLGVPMQSVYTFNIVFKLNQR